MEDNVIKCLLIKSFEIYKDIRKYTDANFTNEEVVEIKEELDKTLDLTLYILDVKDKEINGWLDQEKYDNNIENLKLELMNCLGSFREILSDDNIILSNALNVFAIINRSLYCKGYCMDVKGYYLFSDIDKYSGEDSYFICSLLTSFIKNALSNKLRSAIYFGETF